MSLTSKFLALCLWVGSEVKKSTIHSFALASGNPAYFAGKAEIASTKMVDQRCTLSSPGQLTHSFENDSRVKPENYGPWYSLN